MRTLLGFSESDTLAFIFVLLLGLVLVFQWSRHCVTRHSDKIPLLVQNLLVS